MSFLLRSLLHVLHFFYHAFTLIASRKSRPHPHELSYPRKQIPHHLALLLVADGDQSISEDAVLECFLESVQRAVGWSRTVGIGELTVYDRNGTAISIRLHLARITNSSTGLLSANIEQVSQRLSVPTQRYSEDENSEIEYPLTPPPSDVSDSRPLSPVNLRSLNLDVTVLEVHTTTPVEEGNTLGPKQRREPTPGMAIQRLTSSQEKPGRILKNSTQMKSRSVWSLGHLGNPPLPTLPISWPTSPSGNSSELASKI